MARSFLLVNTNVVRPVVSPVGLEYLGEALVEARVPVRVLDLAFEADWKSALARGLDDDLLAVGISVRNTDDSSFATRKSFLPWIKEVVAETKRLSPAPVVLGGVGFSIMPESALQCTGADAGIPGDGEAVAPLLANCLMKDEDFSRLPNLVYRRQEKIIRNRRVNADIRQFPLPRRRLFANKKYERLGAMVGVETKRGCSQHCVFCADPLAKGKRTRLRPPGMVVQEFHDLIDQGVSWFHLCDGEFNLPIAHAKEACRAIIQAGLGSKIRWYTYCSPTPFDRELAGLMEHAGCAGINFGADSLCDEQLSRLGRRHNAADIQALVTMLKETGLNYMFDLLIGGPGETEATVKTTIEGVKALDIPLAGIACGVRVYQETPLGRMLAGGSTTAGLYPGRTIYEPSYYLSPHLGSQASELISQVVAGDPRFLFLASPSDKASYNYAGDEMLCQWIKAGARGAYWDIIRRHRS